MKILHVLDHSVPVVDGYAIRSQSIVRCQRAEKLEPVVVTSARHPHPVDMEPEVLDGIRYYRAPSYQEMRIPFAREMIRIRKMTAKISQVAEVERPDIIHAHSPCLWGAAARRAAHRRGIPFVYEIRGLWEDSAVDEGKFKEGSLRYRMSRALETSVCRSADIVTTIAGPLKEDLVQRGIPADKIVLTPNCVDGNRFIPLPADKSLKSELGLEDCLLIGYLGTLYPWEGVEDLVRAAPEILRQEPRARILIIAGGIREEAIRQLIKQMNLSDYVRFIGRVPHKDVERYYSLLDVLVYPRTSSRHTELVTPLKPLEAMAMKKAVLGSDVGGIRELLVGETGVVFRSGDVPDLSRKCVELLSSPEKRSALGEKAREHVLATRNWNALGAKYVEVYARASEATSALTGTAL